MATTLRAAWRAARLARSASATHVSAQRSPCLRTYSSGSLVLPASQAGQLHVMAKRHEAEDWAVMSVARRACVGELKEQLAAKLKADEGKLMDKLSLYVSFHEDGKKLLVPLKAYESLEAGVKRAVTYFERYQFLHAGELAPVADKILFTAKNLAEALMTLQEQLAKAQFGSLGKHRGLKAARQAAAEASRYHSMIGYVLKQVEEGAETIGASWGAVKATKDALAAADAGAGADGHPHPRIRLVVGVSGLGGEFTIGGTGVKHVKDRYRVAAAASSSSKDSDSESDSSDTSDSDADSDSDSDDVDPKAKRA